MTGILILFLTFVSLFSVRYLVMVSGKRMLSDCVYYTLLCSCFATAVFLAFIYALMYFQIVVVYTVGHY